jgi:hypothetical protein
MTNPPWPHVLRIGLLMIALIALLGSSVHLWRTNYCFAEWRYVPKSQICAKFLSGLSKNVLTEKTRCTFEESGPRAAFLVFPTEIA